MQAIVLDFDRTLGNVDAILERFSFAAKACQIDISALAQERNRIENDGGSYDPYAYIQKILSKKDLQKFNDHLINNGPTIFYEDVQPFLNQLEEHKIPHNIVTYGVNPDWQRLKIAASGYRGDIAVIGHIDKGLYITSLQNEQGKYGVADSICLIDDKANAFFSLPANCTGFLLQRSQRILLSQKGELPAHVQIIQSLDELVVTNGLITKK